MNNLLDRFIRYVTIDTMSDETSGTCPSTPSQIQFAERLAAELNDLGLSEITIDPHGYLMATLPANSYDMRTVIGFIAHMDTSPDAPSASVRPVIHDDYDGKDLILNREDGIILSARDFRELKRYKGQTIITSDGTTLLGADDKAGIAAIVTALEILVSDPSLKHGRIRVAFTPDEEIGRGADKFNIKAFGADYAYTVDGGGIGELDFETFNAASAVITITGRGVHPGDAKGVMVNAISVARDFDAILPSRERPQFTTGYEGFFHLFDIKGTVEKTTMKYIIRDHDALRFAERKALIEEAAAKIRMKYRKASVEVNIRDQYFNMKQIIESKFYTVEHAVAAYRKAGIEPVIKPVRGGTDGSRLSFMGLPCPNIFTGGHNYHGRFEYIPLQSMQKAVEVIVNIATTEITI